MNEAPAPLLASTPRAIGAVAIAATGADGVSRLSRLRQSGSMKCLLPRRVGTVEGVLINTAGGVTGGDRIAVDAEAACGASLTLTTQAAERIYRAARGEVGRIETRLVAGGGARIAWLPQETILFQGARLRRRLDVDLAPDACLLMCEPVLFGRLARGETVTDARFSDRVRIRRGGRTIHMDGVELDGDVQGELDRAALGAGARAMASVVLAGSDAAAFLDPVRRLLPETGGVSLREGVLLVRLLAGDGFDLRRSLLPILDLLTRSCLPAVWRF